MAKEWGLVFSTDVAVPWHWPQRAAELYRRAGFCSFEMEVMPLVLGTIMLYRASDGYKLPFGLAGIHGRLGSMPHATQHGKGLLDYVKIKALDKMLPHVHPKFGVNLEKIADKAKHPIYYNIHHELVSYSKPLYQHYLERFKELRNVELAIENGPTEKGVELTYRAFESLQADGLEKVRVTYDLLHASLVLTDYDESIEAIAKVWPRVLSDIRAGTANVHFPFGFEDGFDIKRLMGQRGMMRDLRDRLMEVGIKNLIGENQHAWANGVTKEECERTRWLGGEMAETGLIDESQFVE